MTWVDKLWKKKISPYDAWEIVPNEDIKDLANNESLLRIDDLVLAVLEKEKKIQEEGFRQDCIFPSIKELEVRAWRELVVLCKKNNLNDDEIIKVFGKVLK